MYASKDESGEKDPKPKPETEKIRSSASFDMDLKSSNSDHETPKDKPFVHPRSQKGKVLKDHPLDIVIEDISIPMKTP